MTRTGWAALGSGLTCLVLAAVLGYEELAALGIMCAVAVVVALAMAHRRPSFAISREVFPLRVDVDDPDQPPPDEPAAVATLEITNTGSRPSLPMIAVDRIGGEPRPVPVRRLAPGAIDEISYPLPTNRRAVLQIGPLVIERTDPFGLAKTEQEHGETRVLFVHPRRYPLRPLPASFDRSLEGPTSDSAPRGSQAFHQLREYVPGDDRRMIHWRSSARSSSTGVDTLLVRQHVDTSLPDVTIILDNRTTSMDRDRFEAAVEIAASLTDACSNNGFPVRLRTTNGDHHEAPLGQSASIYFLDRLAGVEQAENGDLVALVQLLTGTTAGHALIVVTGHPSELELRALVPLTERFSSVLVVDTQPDGESRRAAGLEIVGVDSGIEFARIWNERLVV